MRIRRVVTGYPSAGEIAVTSDTVIDEARGGPAGSATGLWTTAASSAALDDDGDTRSMTSGLAWYMVTVPPDSERPDLGPTDRAGILHENSSIDLMLVVSGEVWLELDGVDEPVHLKTGDALVQRGTKHAWHNYLDEPAIISCVMCRARRTDATPSRMSEGDPIYSKR
jgi:hypothetical protein